MRDTEFDQLSNHLFDLVIRIGEYKLFTINFNISTHSQNKKNSQIRENVHCLLILEIFHLFLIIKGNYVQRRQLPIECVENYRMYRIKEKLTESTYIFSTLMDGAKIYLDRLIPIG